jgi:hypothetical protein
MYKELEVVVLTHDIDDHLLKMGDVGAVVEVYGDGQAYEVEFVTAGGGTVALLTLTATDLRHEAANEIHCVREMVAG